MQERLYCIRWAETIETANLRGKTVTETVRYYLAPDDADLARETKALDFIQTHLAERQAEGFLPNAKIPSGKEATRLYRERGRTHWHRLFTPRQLFMLGSFIRSAVAWTPLIRCGSAVGVSAAVDNLSRPEEHKCTMLGMGWQVDGSRERSRKRNRAIFSGL